MIPSGSRYEARYWSRKALELHKRNRTERQAIAEGAFWLGVYWATYGEDLKEAKAYWQEAKRAGESGGTADELEVAREATRLLVSKNVNRELARLIGRSGQ